MTDCDRCMDALAKAPSSHIMQITDIQTGKKTTFITKYTEPNWKTIAMEFFCYRGSMSSFYEDLCSAIQKADNHNTERLRKSYPELVAYVKREKNPCPTKTQC